MLNEKPLVRPHLQAVPDPAEPIKQTLELDRLIHERLRLGRARDRNGQGEPCPEKLLFEPHYVFSLNVLSNPVGLLPIC